MALFGAPVTLGDDAWRAVHCAMEMQRELADLNREREAAGEPPFDVGIGINTGTVVAGNIGSKDRMEYTVIGNHVNLASRLADEAAPGEILISERTLALLPAGLVSASPAGERTLKGVNRPVKLYSVVAGPNPATV